MDKLPSGATLLEAFKDFSTVQRIQSLSAGMDTTVRLAIDLLTVNSCLWSAEDDCRAPERTNSELGALKRRIDQLNEQRARLIDQIDSTILLSTGTEAIVPVHTETIGALIDRLSIAYVRSQQLTQKNSEHAPTATSQLEVLSAAYDDLLREVKQGLRQLPRWSTLKSYGDSNS